MPTDSPSSEFQVEQSGYPFVDVLEGEDVSLVGSDDSSRVHNLIDSDGVTLDDVTPLESLVSDSSWIIAYDPKP